MRRSACVMLFAVAACGGEEPPAMSPPPVRVEAAAPTEVIDYDELVATIRSRESNEVRANVDGHITEIAVTAGSEVEAGALLVRIDPAPQEAAVGRARAQTVRARADIVAVRADREARVADVTYATQELARIRELYAADHVSRQELDRATSALRSARAALAAVDARISAANAGLAENAATLREDRARLEYYTVEAPIAGRLGDIPVHVGDRVDPSTVLTTIEGGGGLELSVQIPVELLPRLREGLEVEARSSGGEAVASARIDFVSPQVDPITQTILVKCSLPAESTLRVGQFTRARIIWERREALTVPTTAVKRINTQPFLFVVRDGEMPTVEQRPARLGALYEQRYVVEEGLAPGERVVIAGIQRLGDGAPVTIETSTQEPPATADRREPAGEPEEARP